MIFKKIIIAVVLFTGSSQWLLGNTDAQRPELAVLSEKDKELFTQQIRSVMHDLGFANSEILPIVIRETNGAYAAVGNDYLVVSSAFYQKLPLRWLKAALAHELIHVERNHLFLRNLAIVADWSVAVAMTLLLPIKLCYSRSRKSGLATSIVGLFSFYQLSNLVTLYIRSQEKEADLESAMRWGTAQDFIESLQYEFNRYRNEKLTIDEIRGREVNAYTKIMAGNHPTITERINYLYPIAHQQEQKKIGEGNAASKDEL